MKNKIISIAILILLCLQLTAQKDTCTVGIYVNNLYDFKIEEKSFMIDFWMWVNFKNDSLVFKDNLDLPNSKSNIVTHFSQEKKNGINWAVQKCKAEIMQQWNIADYPFDRQRLSVYIEDPEYDTASLIYQVDKLNSKLDPKSVSSEWDIISFKMISRVKTYATTYGNPMLTNSSSYPQVVAEIVIERTQPWTLLFKLLTGAYVAFLISCLVFFVSSHYQDSRFALCVGGLFAAIGNKYIVESVVPSSNTHSLLDDVHNYTFAYILVIIVICIFSLRLHQSKDKRKVALSAKIDRISFWAVLISYLILNIVLVAFAVREVNC